MNSSNYIENATCMFEWAGKLPRGHFPNGIEGDDILIDDLSVGFLNTPEMSMQKMFLRGIGMVDLIQARALYKSSGVDELNKQMPVDLWVEKNGIECKKPFKDFESPIGLRAYKIEKGSYYLYVKGLPLLDIVKYRALVGSGTSLPMNLYPAAY